MEIERIGKVIKRIEEYHNVLKFIPPIPLPPFEDEDSLVQYWGKNWGVNSEVGILRTVLLHRPGDEMKVIDESKWNEEASALIGDKGSWYWRDRKGPNIPLMQKQHDDFANALRKEGVEVVYLDNTNLKYFTKAVFTRDLGVAVPGGVIIGRFAPAMRRGEEKSALKKFGELGIPILKTIHGTGIFEGGNFVYIDNKHVAIGLSQRTNQEGIKQVQETLGIMNIEVITVPLTGYSLHIDGALAMVDVGVVLVNMTKLPYFFLEKLKELNIKTINVHPDDSFYANNCLTVKPGKIIMVNGSDRTIERLYKEGIEVITIEYKEILKNGGGPRCSSMPLMRDRI